MKLSRIGLTAALATTLVLGSTSTLAWAHDGVDHSTEPGANAALDWSNYEKITLTKDVGEPVGMAVMPDGSVLHTARNGDIRHTDPDTGVTRLINEIDVYANSEDGLQTVTLAPDFEESGWVYLYYAPRVMHAPYPETTPAGSAPTTLPAGQDDSYWELWKGYNQLSRVQWNAETKSLDLSTEQVILEVEVQRGQCCHVGGDVDFDADGNLYLSTGDNTPSGAGGSGGFAPTNDAAGQNPGVDSRRGAGNTNDLRGSILRIHVEDDGSYTIPAGNLFAPGTEGTRPEIFVKGVRNPFRMTVDKDGGAVSWGDYGPDSGVADAQRGPMGYVEWQATTEALNAGWPYCHGPNAEYNDWQFETSTPGEWFDCEAGPKNTSRWNTGLEQLPAVTAPQLYYGDNPGDQPHDELVTFDAQGGQGPMGGPTYDFDPEAPSSKFPEYWDGKTFFYEFSQDYIAAFTTTEPGGEVTHIEQVLPNEALTDNVQPITDSPIDMEFGPDGSLYILDYGDGFFRENPDAGLYRVDYAAGNKSPAAVIEASEISSSAAPLEVDFDGTGSTDPEGGALTYEWDLDGDGTFDETGAQVSTTYAELGQYTVRLRVTDPEGRTGITSRLITVGNVAPTLSADAPANGGFFGWGDAILYSFSTSDPEDGTETNCANLNWTIGLGHDTHAHPDIIGSGCSGAWTTPVDAPEHGVTEKLYAVVVATYTDAGNGDIPPAQGEVSLILNPFVQEAEHADTLEGVEVVRDDSAGGLYTVTSFDAGDVLAWDPVNFTGIDGIDVRGSGDGTISFRWGSADAEPFATAAVDSDGFATVPAKVGAFPEGTGELFVTSTGGVVLDTITFTGAGVSDVTPPTATATLDPAEPTGENGWYTGPVSITVNGTDNGELGDAQVSTDGGENWTSLRGPYWDYVHYFVPFALSEDGEHEVQYRTLDSGGNASEVGTLEVGIDTVAPEVAVTGVADGGEVGSSKTLEIEATDATAGVATTAATIDGEPIELTEAGTIDLSTLPLGEHTLVVTASDAAGHTAETTVVFTVTTSIDDLAAIFDRKADEGAFSKSDERKLSAFLSQATRHLADGEDPEAVKALERFVAATDDEVLVRNAEALIASLNQ